MASDSGITTIERQLGQFHRRLAETDTAIERTLRRIRSGRYNNQDMALLNIYKDNKAAIESEIKQIEDSLAEAREDSAAVEYKFKQHSAVIAEVEKRVGQGVVVRTKDGRKRSGELVRWSGGGYGVIEGNVVTVFCGQFVMAATVVDYVPHILVYTFVI